MVRDVAGELFTSNEESLEVQTLLLRVMGSLLEAFAEQNDVTSFGFKKGTSWRRARVDTRRHSTMR